jgi:uncharacterized membrane protein YhaH (DUF805 family)
MNWYIGVLKKYFVFNGRARRKEYWMFVLFYIIFGAVAAVLDNLLGTTMESNVGGQIIKSPVGYITNLYSLAMLIPSLAVSVRRLHDTSRTGWWILINLIPIIGQIWYLILMVLDSQPGQNKYGPNPKE